MEIKARSKMNNIFAHAFGLKPCFGNNFFCSFRGTKVYEDVELKQLLNFSMHKRISRTPKKLQKHIRRFAGDLRRFAGFLRRLDFLSEEFIQIRLVSMKYQDRKPFRVQILLRLRLHHHIQISLHSRCVSGEFNVQVSGY